MLIEAAGRSNFEDIVGAIEEAEWCAQTYKHPFAIVDNSGGFSVVSKKYLEEGDNVLELIHQVAAPVRCGNCGLADEGVKTSSFATSTWGISGPGQEARGDNL
jgi:hypothetical protein